MCRLSCISMTKALPLASVSGNSSSSPPPRTKNIPRTEPTTLLRRKKQRLQQQKPQQPSIVQMERAIGTGSFRDADSMIWIGERRSLMAFVDYYWEVRRGSGEATPGNRRVDFYQYRSKIPFIWENNSNVCAEMDATNLDFFSPGGFWSHKTTMELTIS